MCHITIELAPNPRALVFDKPAPAEPKPRAKRAPKAAEETAVETTATATAEEPTATPAPSEEKPKAARRKKKTEESDS
jgi:hypothetical protein